MLRLLGGIESRLKNKKRCQKSWAWGGSLKKKKKGLPLRNSSVWAWGWRWWGGGDGTQLAFTRRSGSILDCAEALRMQSPHSAQNSQVLLLLLTSYDQWRCRGRGTCLRSRCSMGCSWGVQGPVPCGFLFSHPAPKWALSSPQLSPSLKHFHLSLWSEK